ncbi:hypothetical protein SSIN_1983 [Streptococcus sinensis]|uniref:Uncharacterized protein n=1 Tax=Streptococcus sinensis TaxID=176090 RepID=A0A0A0DDT6_9STRE|nr:hypothetical protein SSIN_1983 [Streptococcus sinensis]
MLILLFLKGIDYRKENKTVLYIPYDIFPKNYNFLEKYI